MQDMRDLYKAYAAVHDTGIKEELSNLKDPITEMDLNKMNSADIVEVCEEIIEGLFEYGCDLDEAYDVVGSILEEASDNIIGGRKDKIVRIAEGFETAFDTVTDKAERNCEEAFLEYRKTKPLTEKWHNKFSNEVGNVKIHASIIHEDREGVKKGLIEMISKTLEEKKDVKEGAGMHRDAKTGEVVDKAEVGKTYYPNQPKKKTSVTKKPDAFGGRFKKEEVENVEELYKGKHGQTDKQYADSRSQGGKMVSGDSKMSGAEYTHGRRVKAENPGMQPDVGGKTKPKSQGKMDSGTRADIEYRRANLKKKMGESFTDAELDRIEEIVSSWED